MNDYTSEIPCAKSKRKSMSDVGIMNKIFETTLKIFTILLVDLNPTINDIT